VKALYCGACHDIRGFDPAGASVQCRCGNTAGRWGDAAAGEVLMQGRDKSLVRVLGIGNAFLLYTFEYANSGAPGDHTDEEWRQFHQRAVEATDDGYLFNLNRRACPVVVLRVGDTGDVRWDHPSAPS
jgi:hypothetical protein